jgi:hypothetical protein
MEEIYLDVPTDPIEINRVLRTVNNIGSTPFPSGFEMTIKLSLVWNAFP